MPQILENGKLASEFPGPPAFHEVVVDFFCYMIYFGFGGFLKPCLYKEFGKPCAFGRTLYDLDILHILRQDHLNPKAAPPPQTGFQQRGT